ncbi:MAG: SRPBCC family protein [Flaviflexus sp.]|nr:SRPBCC family protein [Flaviflexus sp.]
MSEDKKITATRTIDAPAADIFDILTLPAKHSGFDGSGFVRSDDKAQRIQAVGDVFVMNMEGDHMGGEYKMHNHVSAYDKNKMVGWKPATDDAPNDPPGWEWLYTLEAVDGESTKVSLTYDWSQVTDEKFLALLPLVSEEEMEESLQLLAGMF